MNSAVSHRWAARTGWTSCAITVVLVVADWVLSALADVPATFDLASGTILLVLPVVGALVTSRQPGNAIGWLFLGAGLLLGISGGTYGYAAYALTSDPPLAGGVISAWLTSWVFLPAIFAVPSLLFLLFPHGRPLGPRWRYAVALVVVSLVCQSLGAALRPGTLDEDSPVKGIENPAGVNSELVTAAELLGWTTALAGIVLATCSLVLRYRRSRGDERLQLRWFAFSAVLFLVASMVSTALFVTDLAAAGQVLVLVAFCSIPLTAGIAILRHRLYDIDVVINRALVYGSLTATLAVVYLGSVLVLQAALSPFTDQSDLAVAGSTLAVAALFGPARRRIQAVVDRRFYRSRYDAARTLDAFAGRLRHEVDLEAVGADLRTAVGSTVQPTHVSLWLRGAP